MAGKYQFNGITPPPMDNEAGQGAKLGAKVEASFIRFVQRIVSWGWQFAADLLVDIFDASMKILQPGMKRMDRPLVNAYLNMEGLPPELIETIKAIEAEGGESKIFAAILRLVGLALPFVTGGLAPLGKQTGFTLDYQLRTARPAPAEAVAMFKRNMITRDTYEFTMGQIGVNDRFREALESIYDTNANPNDMIFGYLRGLYGEGELKSRLEDAGIPRQMIDVYVEQAKIIPGVQDLVRMMVREAFNDDTSARFGHDEDYPDQINEFLAKQGLSPEWGKAYWRSHWQLPSPTQVFEMFHRGLINQSDVDLYLKTADYAPYWREKMRGISYTLLTRVDIRRAYQNGLIDENEVFEQYRKRGYDEKDARIQTEIAKLGISNKEKDLSKTDVLGLYRDGLQTRSETANDLVKMGYDSAEAEDLLKGADADILRAQKTDAINYTGERYTAGIIDKTGATNELSLAGLTQVAIERRLLEWDRRIDAAKSIPTVADARRFYLAGIIDEAEFRTILAAHNFESKYIEWYVAEASPPAETT